MQQTPDQRFALAQDQLDRLERLHRSNNSGQHAKYAGFSAIRDCSRLWWFRKQTAVTRPAQMRREHRRLALESEDRGIHVRFSRPYADVARQIARREII